MLTFFKKKVVIAKEKTLAERIEESLVCGSFNHIDWDKPSVGEDGIKRFYINPSIQKCFNSGWFSESDFEDWIKGEGVIVKGNSPEEKKKFFDYAMFVNSNKLGWMVASYYVNFNFISEAYNINGKFNILNENPIKFTSSQKSKEEAIRKIYGYFINELVEYFDDKAEHRIWENKEFSDLKEEYNELYRDKFSQMVWTIGSVTYLLGLTYFGYSNEATQENSSYLRDLLIAKAYYIFLKKNNIEFPDFEFVNKNYYKF